MDFDQSRSWIRTMGLLIHQLVLFGPTAGNLSAVSVAARARLAAASLAHRYNPTGRHYIWIQLADGAMARQFWNNGVVVATVRAP
jgi:hypothetical protein